MARQKRRKYTLEFKQEAVRLVKEQDMSSSVGRSWGASVWTAASSVSGRSRWRRGNSTSAPARASREDVSEGGDLDLLAEFRRLRR